MPSPTIFREKIDRRTSQGVRVKNRRAAEHTHSPPEPEAAVRLSGESLFIAAVIAGAYQKQYKRPRRHQKVHQPPA